MSKRPLDELLKKYRALGLVENMERLYLASIQNPHRPAQDANQFRLALSELYLAAGRPLESRVIFEEAIKVARSQGLDARSLLHARAACLLYGTDLSDELSGTRTPIHAFEERSLF
jgi:hypothetical protein